MKEIWKDIHGYENSYQISNKGRIKSKDRFVKNRNKNCKIKGQLMTLQVRNTYYVINLRKNGKRKAYQVHRLVAETFIPNPNNYSIVNHKDENPLNNNITNLEWCTQKYNIRHSKHKMYKPKSTLNTKTNEKYISKSKLITTKHGKKYTYDCYRVIIKQLNFDKRCKNLETAINVRNCKLKELNDYYLKINKI